MLSHEDRDKNLADIAKKKLGIPTLEVRQSNGLDFHKVSVHSLREALLEAYRLGKKSARMSKITTYMKSPL